MGRLDNLFNKRKVRPETAPVLCVDQAGKYTAEKILYDAIGGNYSLDWSLPQSVGVKGDSRFVGDSLIIVPDAKEDLEIIYGGLMFLRYGSQTPLGELSRSFTNEVDGVGRVFVEIARRES